MNASDAYGQLLRAGVGVLRTVEVAALLGMSREAASKLLGRLGKAGLVQRLREGLWWIGPSTVDIHQLPEQLSAPFPAYISLLSALSLHGMIEQLPETLYVVTLGKTRRISTSAGSFSFHHVAPFFFGGFEVKASGLKLASPEKALLDVAYLSATKTRIFTSLPELTLPRGFRRAAAREWIERLEVPRLRTLVERRFEAFVEQAQSTARAGRPAPPP
jgi:predicted transcriptional regulator of viral defense system